MIRNVFCKYQSNVIYQFYIIMLRRCLFGQVYNFPSGYLWGSLTVIENQRDILQRYTLDAELSMTLAASANQLESTDVGCQGYIIKHADRQKRVD